MPRKKIILITGSMRSGTTLLKALLAEAPDVSNLREIHYGVYAEYNKYRSYYEIYSLSKKKIIVLKKPGSPKIPFDVSFMKLKIIVLARNPFDVVQSLKKMSSLRHIHTISKYFPKKLTNAQALAHWSNTYEKIIKNKELNSHDVFFVKYEDLINNPKNITKKLFSYIESKYDEGVDIYKNPKNFEWKWGHDDQGDKIKTLKVQKSLNHKKDEKISQLIKGSKKVSQLMKILGY